LQRRGGGHDEVRKSSGERPRAMGRTQYGYHRAPCSPRKRLVRDHTLAPVGREAGRRDQAIMEPDSRRSTGRIRPPGLVARYTGARFDRALESGGVRNQEEESMRTGLAKVVSLAMSAGLAAHLAVLAAPKARGDDKGGQAKGSPAATKSD